MAQLVIVSNRVAVPDGDGTARAGGLEVAVKAALKRNSGIWFGWSGRVTSRSKIETREITRDRITYIVVDLAKEDHQEYYNGFANRVLWPILHYRVDLAEFSRRDLSGYLRVNDYFAHQLHNVLKPDDLIWVHDYHLMPLAKALRELGHKNRIGFFLHIPCPPPEMLTALPHHERLIPSLCDYDLVGFQTGDDAFNFSRYLTRECGMHSHDFNFPIGGRTMRVAEYMRSVAVSLPPAASLADAGEAMTAYGLPWVPVVQNGRLLGLVGADDLAAARPSPATTLTVGEITYHLTTIPVSAVMRLDPPVVAPDTPLAEAAGLLRDESVGVLPVVEDGRLVGLLGARDLIALLAAGGPQGW